MAKKQPKRELSKLFSSTNIIIAACFGLVAAFAFIVGQNSVRVANGNEMATAYKEVTAKFLAASSTDCTDATDPIKPTGRTATFYEYLRVNRYANRAVIRGCNNLDHLLAKTSNGWEMTNVNVSLDLRANPTWQKACMIEGITRPDDKVRPENSSIDSMNLEECDYIRQNNKVPSLQDLIKE